MAREWRLSQPRAARLLLVRFGFQYIGYLSTESQPRRTRGGSTTATLSSGRVFVLMSYVNYIQTVAHMLRGYVRKR